MLQKFLAQDDERNLNTKLRRASDDADDCFNYGWLLQSLIAGMMASLPENNLKCYIVQGEEYRGDRTAKSDIKWSKRNRSLKG